jgi:acetyl-CoA carboxylase biotin carboxylase subunit
MIEAGVSMCSGSVGILESFEQTQEIAKSFGYPVMLKATAGGAEKECSLKEEDLLKAWEGARQESAAVFGNDGMYLEKLTKSHVISKSSYCDLKHVIFF